MRYHDMLLEAGWLAGVPISLLITVFIAEMVLT
jgi:hypothetical protein